MEVKDLSNLELVLARAQHLVDKLSQLKKITDAISKPESFKISKVKLYVAYTELKVEPEAKPKYKSRSTAMESASVDFDGELFDIVSGLVMVTELQKSLEAELAALTPTTDMSQFRKPEKPADDEEYPEEEEEEEEEED